MHLPSSSFRSLCCRPWVLPFATVVFLSGTIVAGKTDISHARPRLSPTWTRKTAKTVLVDPLGKAPALNGRPTKHPIEFMSSFVSSSSLLVRIAHRHNLHQLREKAQIIQQQQHSQWSSPPKLQPLLQQQEQTNDAKKATNRNKNDKNKKKMETKKKKTVQRRLGHSSQLQRPPKKMMKMRNAFKINENQRQQNKQDSSKRHTLHEKNNENINSSSKINVDFVVAGFPKCGTTTLLYALHNHHEMAIAKREMCSVAAGGSGSSNGDITAMKQLDQVMADLLLELPSHELNDSSSSAITTNNPKTRRRRGIKCPTVITSARGVDRLRRHSPDIRFVVGLRHPIDLLESFYNYRVTEIYDQHRRRQQQEEDPTSGNEEETIPSFEDILSREKPWKGVSLQLTRYEQYLSSFTSNSTSSSLPQVQQPYATNQEQHRHLRGSSKARVFVYTLEQLEDRNTTRSNAFRRDLQQFLGLQTPLEPFGHENLNHFVGTNAHPETVDICQEKYHSLRQDLMKQGARTANWIRRVLLPRHDIVVGGPRKQFLQSLDAWKVDPCGTTGMGEKK